MKGRIDMDGILWLERAGEIKRQKCVFTMTLNRPEELEPYYESKGCGDWCPLFGEPKQTRKGEIELTLCHNFHVFKSEDFVDEREV